MSLGLAGGSKARVLTSRSKANLIVCDMPLMKEIIKMFVTWRQQITLVAARPSTSAEPTRPETDEPIQNDFAVRA